MNSRHLLTTLPLFASLTLVGCGGGGIEPEPEGPGWFAAVATIAPDFSSGAHALLGTDPDSGELVSQNDIAPTHSDITIAAGMGDIFRIERAQGGNVALFGAGDDVTTPSWQYSVTQGASAAQTNPTALIRVSETKAYIPLYNSDRILIVDPTATDEADFILGEIDFSAYDDGDGTPDVNNAVAIEDKLFVTVQRLTNFEPSNTAYVAVIDTSTDTEIDTGRDPMLNGIPLTVRNPNNDLVFLAGERSLYVQGVGKNFTSFIDGSPPEFTGGVERINVDDYSSAVVVGDVDTRGHTSSMTVVSSTKGYLVAGDFFSNTVYPFDPQTGDVGAAIPALTGLQIANVVTGPNGNVWVSDTSNATVHLLDPATDSITDAVVTNLNPNEVVFFATTLSL